MSWKWICSSFLVEVTLANLVKRFDWKVDVGAMGDDKPDVAEANGIDVCRKCALLLTNNSRVKKPWEKWKVQFNTRSLYLLWDKMKQWSRIVGIYNELFIWLKQTSIIKPKSN
ncbi:hypothetical protein YC2023_073462 [Brassica napus]